MDASRPSFTALYSHYDHAISKSSWHTKELSPSLLLNYSLANIKSSTLSPRNSNDKVLATIPAVTTLAGTVAAAAERVGGDLVQLVDAARRDTE
jgi:hypothetical protein